ncbi:MAG: hypothetical protein OEM52_03715 [bacterium]|nr:hypothetical protein [bacterium]
MNTTGKPPRIVLTATETGVKAVCRYWLGLGRLLELGSFTPFYIFPENDPLVSIARTMGYRVEEIEPEKRARNWEVLRDHPIASVLTDSLDSIPWLQKQLPWIKPEQFRLVVPILQRTQRGWFSHKHGVLYGSPDAVREQTDLWMPLLPEPVWISEARANDWYAMNSLDVSKPVVYIPVSAERLHLCYHYFDAIEIALTIHPNLVFAIGCAILPSSFEPIAEYFLKYGAGRVVPVSTDREADTIWSAASLLWQIDSDGNDGFEPLVIANRVGLPSLLSDDVAHRQWVAAGFGNEVISTSFPQRWADSTIEWLQKNSWELRRERIRHHREDWSERRQAERLLHWLGWQLRDEQ